MKNYFLIKPDGYEKRFEIMAHVKKRIEIVSWQEIKLTAQTIRNTYGSFVPPEHLDAVVEYMMEDNSCVVNCHASFDALAEILGKNMMPSLCEPGTIRNMYGGGKGLTKSGLIIIRNAVHRPKNNIQLEEQIQALKYN